MYVIYFNFIITRIYRG